MIDIRCIDDLLIENGDLMIGEASGIWLKGLLMQVLESLR